MVIGRGRRREHPQPTFCTTTTKKKVRGKNTGKKVREKIVRPEGHLRSRHFVTSDEKGPTRADITQLPVALAQNILPNRASSGHVTSGHFRSLPVAPPQIRLELCPYTTDKLKIEPSNILLLNHIVVYINICSYKRQGILFKPNK
jgi:hypothetical protein